MNTASPVFFLDVSTDWYRKPSVKVAFVLSLLAHATAIALLPGLRVPSPEPTVPLIVELVAAPPAENPPPVTQPEPQRPPPQVVKRQVPAPQTQPKQPEPLPPPVQTRPEPLVVPPPPVLREPLPEPVAPTPEVRSEPPPVQPTRVAPTPQPPPPAPQATARAEAIAPPPPPVRQTQLPLDSGALKAFGEVLAQAIGKRKDYPRLARIRNWQGTTELTLQIGPDGRLQDVHVGHSSGFPMLDAAAIQMVHNAAPLPDVPEVLRGRELTMTVPVVFKLEAL